MATGSAVQTYSEIGVIVYKTKLGTLGAQSQAGSQFFKRVVLGTEECGRFTKDTSEGSATQPSFKMTGPGRKRFRIPVAAGARTLSIDVHNSDDTSPRPKLTVKANPAIGVNADVTGTAAAGAGYKTIGPLSFTPSADGAVWVEIEWTLQNQQGTANWDNLVAT